MNELSQKQLEANRNNAKLGGVKSAIGKAISRYNARKHGLLTKEVLMKGEDKDELLKLERGVKSYIQPIGDIEEMLCERIVTGMWRLKRLLRIETKEMLSFINDVDESDELDNSINGKSGRIPSPKMLSEAESQKMLRYENSIEKSIYRALHELQKLQYARLSGTPSLPLSVDIDVNQQE
jgi:hypothetical protein